MFFFEKKNQKTSVRLGLAGGNITHPNTHWGLKLPGFSANQRQTDKSFFASFFSKKEDSSFLEARPK
jgi:hypothetical protein